MLQCLEKIQEDAYHIVAREVIKTLLYFLNYLQYLRNTQIFRWKTWLWRRKKFVIEEIVEDRVIQHPIKYFTESRGQTIRTIVFLSSMFSKLC